MEDALKKAMEKLEGVAREELDGILSAARNGAAASEMRAMLSAAGVDASEAEVEEALALVQARLGSEIVEEGELDEGQLAAVAGGGNGKCSEAADCDRNFKNYPKTSQENRCSYNFDCDQFYNAAIII